MYIGGSQSQNEGQKRAISRLTLTVVEELLNAAPAASTVRVILPSVLFLRATHFSLIIYNAKPLTIQIDKNHLLPKQHNYDIKKYTYNKGG